MSRGSGTRSSLLWECRKAIEAKKPRYLLMENVKALVSKKFIKDFLEWEKCLNELGYTNYWKVLNSKDYGVPQNRERVFMVSVLDGDMYHFPCEEKLNRFVCDEIDQSVDEKYYCSETKLKYLYRNNLLDGSKAAIEIPIVPKENLRAGDFILYIEQATKDKYKAICPGAIYDASYPNSLTRRGRVQMRGAIAPTLTANGEPASYYEGVKDGQYKIRYITPIETLRLMDVDEDNINKMLAAGISDSQLYKMAGNSIVVAVLSEIFRKLLIDKKNDGNSLF